jgi:putative FmdB family regulatory protein
MPTYVYRREDGSTFEVVQRISEDALTVDPETGQKVQRVISGAGLVFKGSGFYLTDYVHKDGGKKEDKAETKAERPEAKAEPKTEKKAEPAKASPSKD